MHLTPEQIIKSSIHSLAAKFSIQEKVQLFMLMSYPSQNQIRSASVFPQIKHLIVADATDGKDLKFHPFVWEVLKQVLSESI